MDEGPWVLLILDVFVLTGSDRFLYLGTFWHYFADLKRRMYGQRIEHWHDWVFIYGQGA